MNELSEQGQEILKTLKEEFPSLTIELKNDAICVRMDRSWVGIASRQSDDVWIIDEKRDCLLTIMSCSSH
jgi:hypothetical protein